MRMRILGMVMLMGLALIACKDEETQTERLLREIREIDSYLAGNGVEAIQDINGVRMVISKLGKGYPAAILSTSPAVSSSVNVGYVGRLFPDGAQFDAGTVNGAILGYIDGWKIAFTSLPEGSVAKLYIPSALGYGSTSQGSIPANSILEFDVVFNRINRTSAELQRLASDTVAIDDYLASKEITALKDSTGYRYVVTKQGTGAYPGLYTPVKFHIAYKVLTADDKVVVEFDVEPGGQTLNRPIDQLPDALKTGLTKLRAGSDATFYIPSGQGFATIARTSGENTIPANSNLIIEISNLEIVE